jgi:hypothetical protein
VQIEKGGIDCFLHSSIRNFNGVFGTFGVFEDIWSIWKHQVGIGEFILCSSFVYLL